ncbi:MAG: sensor histidine kinase [Flavobacteriales bacterium]
MRFKNDKIKKHIFAWLFFMLYNICRTSIDCQLSIFGWDLLALINLLYIVSFYVQYRFICPLYPKLTLYITLTILNTVVFLFLHVFTHTLVPYEACNVAPVTRVEFDMFMASDIWNWKYLFKNSQMSILITISAIATDILENKYRQENKMITLEYHYLKNQLSPHFLLNSLNNIYSLAVQNSSEILRSIENLSELLKYSLYKVEMDEISLNDEVDHIKLYFSSLIKNDNLEMDIAKLPGPMVKIKPLILFNFIENAIKHSCIETNNDAWIKMYISYEQSVLNFSLKNSISTSNAQTNNIYRGIGLKNTKIRLETFYKDEYSLNITEEAEVFSIELKLILTDE